MLVTLLGTGCPQVHPHRFGPASLVQSGERSFLVDCGSGVTQRMAAAGVSGAGLDALLLTHLHSDHLVDLYQLVEVWRKERELRIAWECRPSTAGLELDITEFEEGLIFDADGLRISTFKVDHRPVEQAFGFLFETAKARVAFSGDTTVCDRLIDAAEDVDLLVHECFIHREMGRGRMRSEQGLANVAAYHTLSSEVGKVAARAGAGLLLLNHLVPVEFDRDALLREVCADFKGPVVIGEDLLSIDVPRRAIAHGGLRLALGQGSG